MNTRLRIFFSVIISAFIFLLAGLFYTQILKGQYYRNLSEQNRIVVIPLEAPRGKIYDRNNELLVDNRISFDVSLIYNDTENIDGLASLLSKTLAIQKKDLVAKILNAKAKPFASTTIVEDIGRDKATILEQYRMDYPGLIITTKPKRNYIYKDLASGIIGYLGKINEKEISRLKTYGYRMTDLVGRSGLEKKYNNYLRGVQGGMQVEIDSLGRQKNVLHIKEPESGKNLYLTVDLRLQQYCDSLMGERKGSIICMNPTNGQILAFVTKPNFDPTIFIKSGSKKAVKEILRDKNNNYPLLNRGISCAYPPGSIFKIVIATAALETGKFSFDESFICKGSYKLSKRIFRCWKKIGHGVQLIDEAIKNSCNVFFYQLGLRTGVRGISLYAKKFSFGNRTGIDLPGEAKGLVPTSQWKKAKTREIWYPGDTVNYSIGQGYLLVTPIQVLCMMSSFANGGYLVKPYIVDKIADIKTSAPKMQKIGIQKETLNLIRISLKKVVNDPHGTGMKGRLKDIIVAGKTGTAQNPKGESHGWFSCFAPFEDPKISVVVFIEYGGKGGLEASIIARKIIEKAKKLALL